MDKISQSPAEAPAGPKGVPQRYAESIGEKQQVDTQLVQQTRDEIRAMVDEISALSDAEISLDEFYPGFLGRMTSALACVAGAVWHVETSGNLSLAYQINLSQTALADDPSATGQHDALLRRHVTDSQPALVQPSSGGEEGEGTANPTDNLLILAPIIHGQKTVGLIEIFQRPGGGPATQRGYLRFVAQMSDLASRFWNGWQVRQLSDQRGMWQRMEGFIRAIHQSLEVEQTMYAIANEGRRLIQADRVSVAICHGPRCSIKAVSGLDNIERRAAQIKKLTRLVSTVIRGRQTIWYTGDSTDVAPQIEKDLDRFLDDAHSKCVSIVPLRRTLDAEPDDNESTCSGPIQGPIIGALIVEQLKDGEIDDSFGKRVEVAAHHAGNALANAVEHNSLFLMPVWKTLGRATWLFRGSRLPKTMAVLTILAVVAVAMWIVPYPFSLRCEGQLMPHERFEIFAPYDGVLNEISIPDADEVWVERGQPLAAMSNNDLLVQAKNLQSRIAQVQETITNRGLALSRVESGDRVEELNIEKELAEARAELEGLKIEFAVKKSQLDTLNIHSPSRGQIVNWQVRRNLLRRPVQRGQNLMTLVVPDGPWIAELEMPEKRLNHLLDAVEQSDQPLEVSFSLASQPGSEFRGQLMKIERKMDVRTDAGNTALVEVSFDRELIPPELLRMGTKVTAKVHCGQRSVGFVWLQDLIETVHSTLLFRL